jgi:hypothetical protein
MRTYTLRWSSKFTRIYKIVLSPFTIFMKFVSDHSLYEKPAVHACFGLLCMSTGSDQVQNLHAALIFCYLHLLFSWSFSKITSSMRNQPCMQVLGFCAWVHTPIKFKTCMQRSHFVISICYFYEVCLRSLLLWGTDHACMFWDSLHACTL